MVSKLSLQLITYRNETRIQLLERQFAIDRGRKLVTVEVRFRPVKLQSWYVARFFPSVLFFSLLDFH